MQIIIAKLKVFQMKQKLSIKKNKINFLLPNK